MVPDRSINAVFFRTDFNEFSPHNIGHMCMWFYLQQYTLLVPPNDKVTHNSPTRMQYAKLPHSARHVCCIHTALFEAQVPSVIRSESRDVTFPKTSRHSEQHFLIITRFHSPCDHRRNVEMKCKQRMEIIENNQPKKFVLWPSMVFNLYLQFDMIHWPLDTYTNSRMVILQNNNKLH